MKKPFKIFFYIILAAVITAVSVAAAVYIKYQKIEKANFPPKYIKTTVKPSSGKVLLGETVYIDYTIKTPWDKKPVKLDVSPGRGSQVVGKIKFNKKETDWGYCIWQLKLRIQPFVNGKIPEGKAKLIVSPDINGKMCELNLTVPKVFSKKITLAKNKLNIASSMDDKAAASAKNNSYIYITAICIVLVIVLVYFFFIRKRKKKEKPQTSWDDALIKLHKLKENIKCKVLNPERSITVLTYIVRYYLEARFEIHASKQTTKEFLKDMESWKSPLSNRDRNFLKEFMVTADMVKFAKYNATEKQVVDAIERAEELVNKTIPREKNET
ncbi:MAG: hypothetical protein K9M56_07600 [Victivallales bacterium]|nr:hypothetical protein [Victivallales bacterium]